MILRDQELFGLYMGILALLVVASIVGFLLEWKVKSPRGRETVANINSRIKAWWVMSGVFAVANLAGMTSTILLFGLLSFLALREFVTLTPTRRGDHRSLLFTFFFLMPLQYFLVSIKWYGMFSVLLPVYAFLFIPTVNALQGDPKNFLERTAKLQWAAMICVYCLSHAPALLMLEIPGYQGENAKLLLFMVLVVQLSDVCSLSGVKPPVGARLRPTSAPTKPLKA